MRFSKKNNFFLKKSQKVVQKKKEKNAYNSILSTSASRTISSGSDSLVRLLGSKVAQAL